MTEVTCTCKFCGKTETHEFPEKGLELWQNGTNIQEAMPEVDVFSREFLITGMCFDCISKTYNKPKPGEDWGDCIGECEECGTPIYEKDKGVCPTCHTKME